MTVSALSPARPTPIGADDDGRARQSAPPTLIIWKRIGVTEPRDPDVLLRVHAAGEDP
jgi:hypothetical protein